MARDTRKLAVRKGGKHTGRNRKEVGEEEANAKDIPGEDMAGR